MESPASLPPNHDRGPEITAILWIEASFVTVVMLARFYARYTIRKFGVDDWSMLGTAILFIALAIVITHCAILGGFRHLVYVPIENATQIAIEIFAAQTLTIFAFGLGKFSIGSTILRILPNTSRWRRRFIWAIIILTIIYNCIEGILTFFQCIPSRSLWDPKIIPTSCWSARAKMVNIYVGGGYNIAVDVILALFPITFIWTLKMDRWKRIRLCTLLGLGLLAAICSSIKLSYVKTLNDVEDLTWGTYNLDVWSASEVFVIIVCGSTPAMKLLWDKWMGIDIAKKITDYMYGNRDGVQGERSRDSYVMLPSGSKNNGTNGTTVSNGGGESKLRDTRTGARFVGADDVIVVQKDFHVVSVV